MDELKYKKAIQVYNIPLRLRIILLGSLKPGIFKNLFMHLLGPNLLEAISWIMYLLLHFLSRIFRMMKNIHQSTYQLLQI